MRGLIGRRRDRLASTTTTTTKDNIPSLSLSVVANNKTEKPMDDVIIVSPAQFPTHLVFYRDADPESIEAIEAVC